VVSASGTVDCGGGETDEFSGAGSIRISVSPSLTSLNFAGGGSFSGSWSISASGGGCQQIIFRTASGGVSGSINGGIVSATFSGAASCFSGSGTSDSLSGTGSASCIDPSLSGTISFSASGGGVPPPVTSQ
jgi:hypothetical protein